MSWASNKIYWLLITIAVGCHVIAVLATHHLVTEHGIKECNPIMSGMFSGYGFLVSGIISTLMLIGAMLVMMWCFNNKEPHPGLTYMAFTIIAVLCIIDATNDILVLMNSPLSSYTLEVMKGASQPAISVTGFKQIC